MCSLPLLHLLLLQLSSFRVIFFKPSFKPYFKRLRQHRDRHSSHIRYLEKMTLSNDTPNEFKLDNVPNDCIQAVKFGSRDNNLLLACSWDTTVRLYDVSNNTHRLQYKHASPVLDCCFQDSNKSWSGSLDGEVKVFDFNSGTSSVIGSHSNSVRCVEAAEEVNAIVTGGWDSNIKLWDSRTSSGLVSTTPQPDRVYTMAICGDTLVVGTQGRRVLVWDVRNMAYVSQRRESSLKYQTRCIKTFPNKEGYVLSSIEGRVAVEYLDPSPEVQKKKYAFKCHRQKDAAGVEVIYPVNAMSFHLGYNTFATGGSDGYVNIWDGFNKKRLCQFHKYPTSITSLAFSPDGNFLAIASSFMQETEEVKHPPPDQIFIRRVTDQETRPK